jgi:uncharacterized protein (UPF0332 family)
LDNLRAAKKLCDEGYLRSSISRSYYAAYCAVTHRLSETGVRFPHGWNNPAHEQLPAFVLNSISLPRAKRYRINRALRILRQARETADYRPRLTVNAELVRLCLHNAIDVLQMLEY